MDTGVREYEHFMLKEIHQQPQALRDTSKKYLGGESGSKAAALLPLALNTDQVKHLKMLHIVACGTSYHAGLAGQYMIEALAQLPVKVCVASEFVDNHPLVDAESVVLVISQSGETADTLLALRAAKQVGAVCWAITNVPDSTMAQEAHLLLPTLAGEEVAIASTKAYSCQLLVLAILAIHLAKIRLDLGTAQEDKLLAQLQTLPGAMQTILQAQHNLPRVAAEIAFYEDVFFMGSGLDYVNSLEASLKLKEVSYMHAAALPAGELRHGPLALITEQAAAVCLVTQAAAKIRIRDCARLVLERGGRVLIIDGTADDELRQMATWYLPIPAVNQLLSPLLSILPLQLLAYHVALAKGCNVDSPRNLVKSVTFESFEH